MTRSQGDGARPTEAAGRARSGQGSGGLKVGRPSFLWSLPAVTYFAIFAILPLGIVAWLSFTNWDASALRTGSAPPTGVTIFKDPVMIQSFKITAILLVLGVMTQTPVSLLLGVWAAGHQKNRAILSAIYFIPLLMCAAAISIVWFSLLNPYFGLPHELHCALQWRAVQPWLSVHQPGRRDRSARRSSACGSGRRSTR